MFRMSRAENSEKSLLILPILLTKRRSRQPEINPALDKSKTTLYS